jgi:endoglucanase
MSTQSTRYPIELRIDMNITSLIKKLSETDGISGHESSIRSVVVEEYGRFADEVQVDKMGSVTAIKRGTRGSTPTVARRSVMLAAHMDEIGLIVTGVEKGFLRVAGVGGVDPRVLLAQEVIVHGRRDLPGVIASLPPHLQAGTDTSKTTPIDRLWVDIGLGDAQAKRTVRVGDVVSIRRQVSELRNDLLSGKAFDNRLSVAAIAVCLEALTERQHAWDVLGVATVQEETTMLGAFTSAYKHAPDVAIAIDVTFGAQNGSSDTETFPLGKGPTIGVGPNVHPKIADKLRDVAKRNEMGFHTEPMPGGSGTDAWGMQVAREGIPCGVIGIPLRSMHTPVEIVAVKDVERSGRLVAAFIAELDEEFYKSLTE